MKACCGMQGRFHSFIFSQPCDFATTIRKVVLHHFELPGPVVFKLDVHLESPTDLVKTNYWAPRICISNKFQGNAAAAGLGTTF